MFSYEIITEEMCVCDPSYTFLLKIFIGKFITFLQQHIILAASNVIGMSISSKGGTVLSSDKARDRGSS